jgi:hypothetical protein
MKQVQTLRLASAQRQVLMQFAGGLFLATLCQGQTLSPHNFGNPTTEEQLYIEYINRARANPTAEGIRLAATTDPDITTAYAYFNVNLTTMKNELAAIARQAPLAPNACLTTAARGHTAWMLASATQSHDETNPYNTTGDRISNAGYPYWNAGENIYASAKSVWYGHAGFEVDWGFGTGGMQVPRGHRDTIHNAIFRDIGVGVTLGTNGAVGPQLVTQDFGVMYYGTLPLGTGVAYYDLNANNFYDVGEGISGLTVNVSGTGITNYCTTASGGGWVVPVPDATATRTVTFTGPNVNQSVSIRFVKTDTDIAPNVKADLKLSYARPSITSPATATAGTLHTLTFAAVGGATGYKWNRYSLANAAAENCESTANITSSTTGTYAVLNTSVKQQGSASFHLENSTGASQSLQLNQLYYGQASPSVSFQSCLRYAVASEQFKVQIKEEGSVVWQDVYSQAGGAPYETSFNPRTATLTGIAGKAFRVRFLLSFSGLSYLSYSGDDYGWFVDAITFTGVSTLGNNASQTLTGTSGSFTPSAGIYLMTVAPVISSRDFPASYQTLTVNKLAATLILGNLTATCDGTPKSATATTAPVTGLAVSFTYDGSPTAPTAAGTYAVVATINDTNYHGSASGNLVISPPNTTSFANWSAHLEATNGLPAGTLANQPDADRDHDGRPNLIEYAFGSSPLLSGDPAPRLPFAFTTATHFVLQYQCDTSLTDITITAQASTTPGNWKRLGDPDAPSGFSDTVIATSGTLQTHQSTIPRPSRGISFMRVQVSIP